MRRVVVSMLVVAVALDVLYWTLWFAARSTIAADSRAAYYEFENAFPLADAWLAVACVAALVTLLRGHRAARFWLTCAGAAGTYLFGMDFLYDVEHGMFVRGAGGAIEAVIVALTAVFSATALTYAWRLEPVPTPG